MDDSSDISAIIKDFLVETAEHLDRLDADVLALEQNSRDVDRLASVFRSFHTIKGTCAWLGFTQLEGLAHSAESLLAAVRDGTVEFSSAIATLVLAVGDAVGRTLPSIEATHGEGDVDFSDLRARLDSHNPDSESAPPSDAASEDALTDASDVSIPEGGKDRTVRVDVQLLDKLMNYVGELVLARNQIVQGLEQPGSNLVPAAAQRLKAITSELQQGVMKTRLQPIGSVWNKLPRLVREIGRSLEKDVRLSLEGGDTEVDRSLLQAIKDPLTHLVRNAADHGIESMSTRIEQGKPVYGTIRLRAYHENGQVIVEVADDGGGLDLPRIKGVAVARGLITSQQALVMNDRELTQLVFRAGFSTKQNVTHISGRGVGLDVVKTQVERIGGNIEIESTRGLGTTLRLKMPLTLAIIPALLVRSRGSRYALAQTTVIELVRISGEQVNKAIDHVYEARVLRLRGALVPLVDLSILLGGAPTPLPSGADDTAASIVICEIARQRFGLIVDSIGDNEEIVVKPLGKHLAGIPVYSGATVMSDGKVGLILDTQGIAHHSGVLDRASTTSTSAVTLASAPTSVASRYLIAASRDGGQLAIPIEHVDRLEELKSTSVERVGAREVVQYRGGILPLVRVTEILEERRKVARGGSDTNSDRLFTIVYREGYSGVGIVVDRIVDIINDTSGASIGESTRRGSAGTIVALGRITEILDLHVVLEVARGSISQVALAQEQA